MRQGFTLLELSIVLVIIGLIVGGIMTGQTLVRSAELRAVGTESQRFQTAFVTFKDKYGAIPGDIKNATFFFGKDNTNCSSNTGTAATPGACNGDGNAQVAGGASTSGAPGEAMQAWRHLSLAGLIPGTFTGLAGSVWASDCPLDTACPRSKFNAGGWSIYYVGTIASGDGNMYALDDGNSLVFGGESGGNPTWGQVLSPNEAFNIDTKLDDGKPASGQIVARYWNNLCATNNSGTLSNTNFDAVYRVTDSTSQCALYFRKAL